MKKLTDLKFLFTAVAILEISYFFAAMLPMSLIEPATGWILSPDGHWITKLMGVSLLTQGCIAWIFRKEPHLGVAKLLAFYQFASATTDWVMWLLMKNQGIFKSNYAKSTVVAAIVSHYLLGLFMVIAIRKAQKQAQE